jgi:hypothetical protein
MKRILSVCEGSRVIGNLSDMYNIFPEYNCIVGSVTLLTIRIAPLLNPLIAEFVASVPLALFTKSSFLTISKDMTSAVKVASPKVEP